MAGELHIGNDQFQYIARISHGKDSLKMLDVIVSRGLRLDRITTTDIWATDTRRFQLEDEHFLVPGDPRFKWSMLDGDLQYRLF